MLKRYRFPGSKSFSSDESIIFFGRKEDVANLSTSVFVNPTTVIFGKSATGKSSLIQAGLIPELRNMNSVEEGQPEPYLPITILPKIYSSNVSKSLHIKIADIIEDNIEKDNFLNLSESHLQSSLWYLLKQFQYKQHVNKKQQVLVLIFDQGEELFTYPEREIEEFVKELHPVIGQFIPEEFRQIVKEGKLSPQVNLILNSPPPVKFIFSIRSDKLHLITRLKKASPHILQNSYELLPLQKYQVDEAMDGPSLHDDESFVSKKFIITKDAKKYIFQELSGLKDLDYNFEETRIEPFSLQIICSYIEQKIVPKKDPNDKNDKQLFEVNRHTLEGARQPKEIINDYYISCIDELKVDNKFLKPAEKEKVRILIEERMISDNRRIPIHIRTIEQDIECPVRPEILNALVDTRILNRNYDSHNESIYEVTHDCLIEPILKAKTERLGDKIVTRSIIDQLKNEIIELEGAGISNTKIERSAGFDEKKTEKSVGESNVASIELKLRLTEAYKKLGEAYNLIKDYKNAIESLDKANESIPDQSNNSLLTAIYRARADAYFFLGQYEKSNEDLMEILKQNPNDNTASTYLVENYDSQNRLDEAFLYFNELKISSENAGVYNVLGNKFYAKRLYEKAKECYLKAIEVNPIADYAFSNIGLVENALGNFDSSLANYAKAAALNPNSAVPLNDIGNVYYSKGEYGKAKQNYLRAVEIDPGYYYSLHNLGLIEEINNNEQSAIEYYNKAIAVNPSYENSHLRLASIFFKNKDYDRVKEIYQKLIEMDQTNPLNYHDIGLVEENLQNWQAAITYFKKATELDPNYDKGWYRLGKAQYSCGENEEAIKSLEIAIDLNPKNAEYTNELGLCYYNSKEWGLAKKYFENAAILTPEESVYHTNVGLAEFNLNNLDEAEKHFRKSIGLRPNDKDALVVLASIYFKKKDWRSAKETYEKLVEIGPENAVYYYDLGLIEENLQNWQAAITHFKKATELDPNYDKGWYRLGKAQYSCGENEEAIKSLEKAIDLNPKNAEYTNELGLCYYDSKEWGLAKKYFESAAILTPEEPVYHTNVGLAEFNLNNLEDAEKHLRKSIEIKPDDEVALVKLAGIYFKKEDWRSAKETYEKLVEIGPMNELNYYDLGQIEEKLQDFERATDHFKKVIEINKNYDKAWYKIGQRQREEGDINSAIKNLERALELNPQNDVYHNELGLCFFKLKEWEEAKKCFTKSVTITPEDYVYQSNLGAVDTELGNFDSAEKYLQKSIEINSEYALTYFNYGELLEKQNKIREAIIQYEKYLELAPNDAEANDKIIALKKTIQKES